MLLPELLLSLGLQGDPVAMLPNRSTLLVAGSDDRDGLAAMGEFAATLIDKPRFLSGIPLKFSDGGWSTFDPYDSPSALAFARLRLKTLARTYAQQKEMLDDRNERENIDLFVAQFSIAQPEDGQRIMSVCTWSKASLPFCLARTWWHSAEESSLSVTPRTSAGLATTR